jgi:hypothetical protein
MLDRPANSPLSLDRGLLKRLHAVLALSAIAVWTWPAHAATVAIVSPPFPAAEMTEALNLLRGELLSVGLGVAMEGRPADHDQLGPDARRWLEDLAAKGASAIVDAVEVDAGLTVDVWIVKTNPLRFEVTRVAVDPDTPKPSEVLALRAVEALRAGLLLIDRAARRQQLESNVKPPPTVVPASAGGGSAEPRERLGLDIGVAALASLDGIGLAILPMLRMSWAIRPSILAQVSLVGAGTRPRVTTTGGTARIAQQYGTLGVCYRLRFREWLWPFFAVAAGGMHTSAEGQADAVSEGQTVDQWSFLLDSSLGAGLRVYRRTYLTLAAHVQLAEPYVAIHSTDAVAATTGRPNLVLTLTVGAWL